MRFTFKLSDVVIIVLINIMPTMLAFLHYEHDKLHAQLI